MLPILFQFGPLTIYSFGVFMALAAVTAAWVVHAELKTKRLQSGIGFDDGLCRRHWRIAWS